MTESFDEVCTSYDYCTWVGRDGVKRAIDRLKAAHESEIAELQRQYEQNVIELQRAHKREMEGEDGNDDNDSLDGYDYGHYRCNQHQVSYDELGTTLSDLYGIWQDGAESESRGSKSARKMTKSTEIGKSGEHVSQLEHVMEMWRDRAEDMRMERDDLQSTIDELQEKNRHLAQKCDTMLVLFSNRAMDAKSDQEQRIEKLVRQRDELREKLKAIGGIVDG